ncbi:MAG: ATP-grasp domain-containing protein [Planctomycetota bacterium]|jgi:hypothetical protein
MNIAFARCAQLPEPDPDEQLLLDAARDAGFDAHPIHWDDPSHDPGEFDAVILRATWNYYIDPDAFVQWLRRTHDASVLLNPMHILQWNLHKSYLTQLKRVGIPIVPTSFCKRQQSHDLEQLTREQRWGGFVVKPAVSAASFRTMRFDSSHTVEAQAFLDELLDDRDAMIQRYMPSVETHGERNIIVIDNKISHTIRKNPRFTGDDEHVSDAIEPSPEEREFAERVLEAMPESIRREDLLYARVDVMHDDDGELVLSELELLEPSLFLLQEPCAIGTLLGGIARRLRPSV